MSFFSGGASSAAENAADAQAEAIEKGIETQFRMFRIGRRDLAPYRQQGYAALNLLGQMYGLPPIRRSRINPAWREWNRARGDGASTGAPPGLVVKPTEGSDEMTIRRWLEYQNKFMNREGVVDDRFLVTPEQAEFLGGGGGGGDLGPEPKKHLKRTMKDYGGDFTQMIRRQPGYKFRFKQGMKALDQSAAAGGRLFSGRQLKEVTRYGQNYASAEYDRVASRLAQLAGLGGGAASTSAGLAQSAGQNIASSQTAIGTARASGYIGAANSGGGVFGPLAALGLGAAALWGGGSSGGFMFGCFAAGSKVRMADGSEKPIEEIKVGDSVLSFTESGDLVSRRVVATTEPEEKEVVQVNGGAICTPGHRFATPNGFEEVCEISEGLDEDGTSKRIETKPVGERTVYNFSVEDTQTYIIEGWRVHNVKHRGGAVRGPEGADIPEVLQEGEFVISRKAAKALGIPYLAMLNAALEEKSMGKREARTMAKRLMEYA